MARIEQELEAEELDFKKPTMENMLKSSITRVYESSDLAEAKYHQDHVERKFALERVKSKYKKSHKWLIAAQRRYIARCADPCSDIENCVFQLAD